MIRKTVAVLASCASLSWGCPKGSELYRDGVCVVDIKPESAPDVKPSNEKPPNGRMPSYQREGIHIVDIPAMKSVDDEIATARRHSPKNQIVDATAGKPSGLK